jgi:hypothetical protein
MDSILAIALSPAGRVALLSLIVGLATQGLKTVTPGKTWLRAFLPAIPILLGGLLALIPGVLIGEGTLLLGLGAGAISSSLVELYNRYKEQAGNVALKRLGEGASDGSK